MKSNLIRDALNTVNPTESQKDRMREVLIASLPVEPADRRQYRAMPRERRRLSWLSAAAAVVTIVLLCGFLFSRLNTEGIRFSPSQITMPNVSSKSLEHFFESAPYRASLEWNAYLETCEESNEGLRGPYPYYGCSSAEMMEKLDALCETYGLNLEEERTVVNDYDRLMDIVCVDTLFRPISGVSQSFTNFGSSYYSDGSFEVCGETVMQYDGSPWVYPITFRFCRVMKTTFYDVFLDIGDITQYAYWEYTTQSGVELLLALRQDQTLILTDCGDSVILVFTTYDRFANTEYRELSMDKAALEAFAETFDYTLPPNGGIVPIPEPRAVAAAQLEVHSMSSLESTIYGTIEKGTLLTLVKQEIVNGKSWGFVNGDNAGYPSGWVEMEDVELTYTTEPSVAETIPVDGAIPQAYRAVVETYVTAINERWGAERCSQEDISIVLRDVESLDSLGYALMDLDGDGVEELIVACDEESQPILDLYTLVGGELVHVFSGGERNQYFLRQGGRIINIGSGGAARTTYVLNCLSGGNLVQEQVIYFDADENADAPWFMGFDRKPVTGEEAQAAISAYTTERISLTLLSKI